MKDAACWNRSAWRGMCQTCWRSAHAKNSPPQLRRGGRDTNKISRSFLFGAAGVVLVNELNLLTNTTPASAGNSPPRLSPPQLRRGVSSRARGLEFVCRTEGDRKSVVEGKSVDLGG